MASYDLKCRSCGKEFEVFVLGFLKDGAKVCPECGSKDVERRYTAFEGVISVNSSSDKRFASCPDGGRREPASCPIGTCCNCGGLN